MKTEEYVSNESKRKSYNKAEINDLPDKEFKVKKKLKVLIIRMQMKSGEIIDEHGEVFNKELESMKKNLSDLKNTITEMKKLH